MRFPRTITTDRQERRRAPSGLAMLELVLALPIFLFVMALMVNYGIVACWKARGLVAARHAAWSSRPPRTPDAFPLPTGCAGIADIATRGPDYAQTLDNHAALRQPVVRGPLPLGNEVNTELLNCNRGLRSSEATIQREFPLLRPIGPYQLRASTEVLGDVWQFREMGLRHNGERRIPVIYHLVEPPAALLQAHIDAVLAVLDPELQWAVRTLDHDDEFIEFGRLLADSSIMTWRPTAPDFHPVLSGFCARDPQIAQQRVDELVKRIEDVPKNLARGFKSLYERVIKELEWRMANDLSLPPGDVGKLMAEIAELRAKIAVLDTYLQSLP